MCHLALTQNEASFGEGSSAVGWQFLQTAEAHRASEWSKEMPLFFSQSPARYATAQMIFPQLSAPLRLYASNHAASSFVISACCSCGNINFAAPLVFCQGENNVSAQ